VNDEYDDGRLPVDPGPADPAEGDPAEDGPGDQAGDQEQARVSALLARVGVIRSEEALPEEVAARLADVLSGLAAERAATEPTGSGPAVPPDDVVGATDLAGRRRRRWPALLVAAATVSVVGLGLGNVVSDYTGGDAAVTAEGGAGSGGEEAAAEADGLAGSAPVPDEENGDTSLSEDRSGSSGTLRAPSDAAPRQAPRLRSDSLALDLERAAVFSLTLSAGDGAEALEGACVQPATEPDDEWLPVRLDGDPAVLVLRDGRGGRRTAEVFTCDDGDTPAASVRIEAP
jgi:hypothetical protein